MTNNNNSKLTNNNINMETFISLLCTDVRLVRYPTSIWLLQHRVQRNKSNIEWDVKKAITELLGGTDISISISSQKGNKGFELTLTFKTTADLQISAAILLATSSIKIGSSSENVSFLLLHSSLEDDDVTLSPSPVPLSLWLHDMPTRWFGLDHMPSAPGSMGITSMTSTYDEDRDGGQHEWSSSLPPSHPLMEAIRRDYGGEVENEVVLNYRSPEQLIALTGSICVRFECPAAASKAVRMLLCGGACLAEKGPCILLARFRGCCCFCLFIVNCYECFLCFTNTPCFPVFSTP